MPVTVVGDTTYGKPVGQYGFDFCDKVLYPVAFRSERPRRGRLLQRHPRGLRRRATTSTTRSPTPREASLSEALAVLRNGRCSGQAAAARAEIESLRRRVVEIPRDGWRQTLNAW